MNEAIKILREQIVLLKKLVELFEKLIDVLKKNNSAEVPKIVQEISPLITELSKIANSSNEFLNKNGYKTLAAFVNSHESSMAKEVAENLLNEVDELHFEMRKKVSESAKLLANGKEFIDFNLNILLQTSANTTYGSSAETGSQSKKRMFEANV